MHNGFSRGGGGRGGGGGGGVAAGGNLFSGCKSQNNQQSNLGFSEGFS